MIRKTKNQENIMNFLNGIDNTHAGKALNIDKDFSKKNMFEQEIGSKKNNNYNDENFIEIERSVFNHNMNNNQNLEKSNINLKKLKIENFQEKIQRTKNIQKKIPPLSKKPTQGRNEKEIKQSRLDKIRNFIQEITSITNKSNEDKIFEKKDINRSVNYKEKNICEFELDSDYDMFLGKPLTDREERDRLNIVLEKTIKDVKKGSDYCQMNNIETSYRYEEGGSHDFNERVGINDFYNVKYNNMEHLYSERINKI